MIVICASPGSAGGCTSYGLFCPCGLPGIKLRLSLHGTVIIMLLTASETPLFMSLSLGWGNDMKNRDTGKQRLDMLHGSLWDKIPRFALPIAATAILGQLFNAADIAVVGNFAGDVRTQSVAAVGANGGHRRPIRRRQDDSLPSACPLLGCGRRARHAGRT